MPDDTFHATSEFAAGLKLAARGFLLVIAGSLVWHIPASSMIVTFPLAAIAALVFCFAAALLVVSAITWRNATWNATLGRRFGWRGGRAAAMLLGLPYLGAFAFLAYGLFERVGAIYS